MSLALADDTPAELLEFRPGHAVVRVPAPVDGFVLVAFDEFEGHADYLVPLDELRIVEVQP
jgi:hypothetical protein